MNQLLQIFVPYRIVGIGPSTRHAPRTERSSYLPQVVDVGKLVARDLLLIGGAPVVGVFERVEMWVGVEPAQGVCRLERHMRPVAEHLGGREEWIEALYGWIGAIGRESKEKDKIRQIPWQLHSII